ncbi:MAG: 16S rRNA (guanine(966)-N(2))-methyltransferase RsmD [Bifidobacteriaceae bacterium]|nr:16S rRNA (guanine(966)-N(2))-methyltransferase RsmD [Bifidobacteriaceae bacterium]
MTRIIAGSAGGRVIKTPPSGTRPTTDRVREALFSLLEARLGGRDGWSGLAVADLYAGSGALALEALSRGAASALAVESSRPAARTLEANARVLGFEDRLTVECRRVEDSLARGALKRTAPFDLLFLDPPYSLGAGELDAVLGGLAQALAPGGLAVVERSSRSPAPTWPTAWEPLDCRAYGETTVHLARPNPQLATPPKTAAR